MGVVERIDSTSCGRILEGVYEVVAVSSIIVGGKLMSSGTKCVPSMINFPLDHP